MPWLQVMAPHCRSCSQQSPASYEFHPPPPFTLTYLSVDSKPNRLRYLLVCTMGAPEAFEYCRCYNHLLDVSVCFL